MASGYIDKRTGNVNLPSGYKTTDRFGNIILPVQHTI
jgi:hypothetical protein